MDRLELETALRDAGVGGDLSIALAAELVETWPEADGAEESLVAAFVRPLREAWGLADLGGESERRVVANAADADTVGDLGNLPGPARRMKPSTSSITHPRPTPEVLRDARPGEGGTGRMSGPATSDSSPRRRSLRTAGRQLRTLPLAADLSVEEAAIAVQSTVGRIRELEAGTADLLYLEGLALAKSYLLCSSCFSKHFRLASARAGVQEVPEEADAE